ncbi:MAG TPA: aminotransferase class III-fold pyridoxal phosphate-dependent enzyme [Candidatus Avoscillospira stercoripullorum]|uniref:Aminotransferase class III-fold pyridoxal phosphate-dependent enzyme n=1 Tax=Candidatus Avoscillospira stercoripullorum TaxID=2840709 RepID=A0A9D1D7M0_9FIRM|nr:aminotransferase class III-fold pyridoxal phosphate-dependent enzyme [Candidatus Avoscillospira stercoripullorum]
MAYNGFAIDTYLDAEAVNKELDALIQKPVYTIRREKLKDYVQNYFEQKCSQSKAMIAQAKKVIPGGVQHNLAFNYPFPIVITKAEGAKLYDLDGNWYYDLLQAGGPTILGSNMPAVREPVMELLKTCGPSTGLFHEFEYKLAKKISDLVPSVEMFRMLGSGTEADMVAVRIARLKTGHKNILKMGGAYHGWSDQLAYGIRIPGTKGILSKGVPGFVFKHTDEFFPGDLEDLERKLKANRLTGGTAAVFIEPVGPESGTWPVSKEFIRGAVELAHRYGALAVFDEVVTGFRIGLSGAQGYFGVDPDLTVFGKIIAGGYPGAGGIGGHASCMAHLGAGLDSSGKKVPKAMCGGTMAATPISCVAGYYALCEIERTNACEVAGRMGDRLTKGLQALIQKYNLPFVAFNQGSICHLDSVGTMHFSIDWKKPWTIPQVLKQTSIRQKEMEHMGAAYMAEGIVTLAGSRLYTSAAYTEEMIDDVLVRFDRVLSACAPLED